jgi:pyridoxal phosphate phosphatase PHOSPHO2
MPVVWDFDHSLIPDNSDTWIPAQLLPSSLDFIRAGHAAGQAWTPLMDATLSHLHSKGVTSAALLAAAASLPSDPAIVAAILALHAKGIPQYILSDANSLYISAYLGAHQLTACFQAVHTNPATVQGSDCVSVGPYHSPPPGCPLCPPNLCKGRVLDGLREGEGSSSSSSSSAAPAAEGKWVYIGDGGGDHCPCLRLAAGDCILAREGWELAKRLGKAPSKARVVQWKDGKELAAALAEEF